MKRYKHEIKLSLIDKKSRLYPVSHTEYTLRADILHTQHSHSVQFLVSEGDYKFDLDVSVDDVNIKDMTPDQKVAAGLGGFSVQEVYDAVETFLAAQ